MAFDTVFRVQTKDTGNALATWLFYGEPYRKSSEATAVWSEKVSTAKYSKNLYPDRPTLIVRMVEMWGNKEEGYTVRNVKEYREV
jgi:hypothetical protein